VGDGDTVVERLKAVQELLDTLTDGYELEAALQEEDVEATGPALEQLRREREAITSRLRQDWRQAGPDLGRQIDGIARQLLPGAKTPPSMLQRPRRRRRQGATV
jgi:hypothetical protein